MLWHLPFAVADVFAGQLLPDRPLNKKPRIQVNNIAGRFEVHPFEVLPSPE